MESTSGTGIDTGSALRAATFTEAVEAITAGLKSEAFVDVHVMLHMTMSDPDSGVGAVTAWTVCAREQASGPSDDVCALLTFLRFHGAREEAATLVVRWTGDSACCDTAETDRERAALESAEMRLRSIGATMWLGPSANRCAQALVKEMNQANTSKMVMENMVFHECGSGATDGNG